MFGIDALIGEIDNPVGEIYTPMWEDRDKTVKLGIMGKMKKKIIFYYEVWGANASFTSLRIRP